MKKAATMLRRSSVKLKSLSGGNEELLMVISQITAVKNTFKAFMNAQMTLYEDLQRWVNSIENNALKEALVYLCELSTLWGDVQNDFHGSLRKFRSDFEMVLEDEKQVEQAKKVLASSEHEELNAKKTVDKLTKQASLSSDLITAKLSAEQAEKAKALALKTYNEKSKENEAVRMIRVKECFKKMGSSYLEMSTKECAIFQAHNKVADEIPDIQGTELHNIRFRGSQCMVHIQRAKDEIRSYHDQRNNFGTQSRDSVYPSLPRSQSCRFSHHRTQSRSSLVSPNRFFQPNISDGVVEYPSDLHDDDPPPPYNPYYETFPKQN